MAIKLLGSDDIGASGSHAKDYISLTKFTAVATGSMVEFRVKAQANGNFKFGIYSDNAGAPNALLNSVGSTACTTGWNTITFPATNIVSGTVYWLAINTETVDTAAWVSTGGVNKYKPLAYASAFPDPAGTGYTDNTGLEGNAGWGTEPSIGNFFQLL